MADKKLSLEDLKKEIAKLRSQAKTASERVLLQRELKELRDSQSNNTLKRISRGFKVLVKKGATATGKGVVKLRKFAVESGATEGLDFNGRVRTPVQRRVRSVQAVRRVRRIRRRPITTAVIRRTTIRRIKVKPKKRKIVRRAPTDDGFFGGLTQF